MRIVHVLAFQEFESFYGLGTYIREITRAQAEQGHDVRLLCVTRSPDAAGEDDQTLPGRTVERVLVPEAEYWRDPAARPELACDRLYAMLEQRARSDGTLDRIFTHDWFCVPLALRLAPWSGAVHVFHIGESGKVHPAPACLDLERMALEQGAAVVFVSEALMNVMLDGAGVPYDASRHHVIHHGHRTPEGPGDPEWFDGPADPTAGRRPAVLFVGRLAVQKGVDELLRSVAPVRLRRPDVEWWIAGDGPLAAQYRAAVAVAGLDDCVHFLGRVEDRRELTRLYRTASVFCMPSRFEPFGLAFYEAWAHRLPVVVTRCGGPGEVVEDGETGLVVEPKAAALATACLELLEDREHARELAERAHRALLKRSWRRVADELAAVPSGGFAGSAP